MVSAEKETLPAPEEAEASKPKRQGHGRPRLPESLPRKRVGYDLGEHGRQCPHCQQELRHIGEEVTERLEYVPASLYAIEEACRKYACSKGYTLITWKAHYAAIRLSRGRYPGINPDLWQRGQHSVCIFAQVGQKAWLQDGQYSPR